jgi:hypothetical protein
MRPWQIQKDELGPIPGFCLEFMQLFEYINQAIKMNELGRQIRCLERKAMSTIKNRFRLGR